MKPAEYEDVRARIKDPKKLAKYYNVSINTIYNWDRRTAFPVFRQKQKKINWNNHENVCVGNDQPNHPLIDL